MAGDDEIRRAAAVAESSREGGQVAAAALRLDAELRSLGLGDHGLGDDALPSLAVEDVAEHLTGFLKGLFYFVE